MSKGKPKLPEQRNYSYALDTALEIALKKLAELKDIKELLRCMKNF